MTTSFGPTAAPVEKKQRAIEKPLGAAIFMAALLGVLWLLEVIDQATNNSLDQFGIQAREVDGLPEIFTAPWLHAGWGHLAGNSLPFFVLGFLVLIGGFYKWIVATLVTIVTSGLAAWSLTPTDTLVLGASGIIFGWLTYLLARGVFARSVGQIAIALVVLFLYGGVLWGVFPGELGISWQAHLGGAIGGILAAWLLHRRSKAKTPSAVTTR